MRTLAPRSRKKAREIILGSVVGSFVGSSVHRRVVGEFVARSSQLLWHAFRETTIALGESVERSQIAYAGCVDPREL